jgi:hypothetical protein
MTINEQVHQRDLRREVYKISIPNKMIIFIDTFVLFFFLKYGGGGVVVECKLKVTYNQCKKTADFNYLFVFGITTHNEKAPNNLLDENYRTKDIYTPARSRWTEAAGSR